LSSHHTVAGCMLGRMLSKSDIALYLSAIGVLIALQLPAAVALAFLLGALLAAAARKGD
jgi:hypothetical protein